jgi:DNA-directed RNA polymerase specialized sigma24 family protein
LSKHRIELFRRQSFAAKEGPQKAEQQNIEGTLHAQEILNRMDEWSRKVWVAREYGYSWKHIGRVLGIPGDSVMLRFRRRMKILRARLSGGR